MTEEEKKKLKEDLQFLRTMTAVTATISGLGFLAVGVAMSTGSSLREGKTFNG